MKLLAVERTGAKAFVGYTEDGDAYQSFHLADDKWDTTYTYPKKDYPNYEHFAAVIGKFDPYSRFLREPIPLLARTEGALLAAMELIPAGYQRA